MPLKKGQGTQNGSRSTLSIQYAHVHVGNSINVPFSLTHLEVLVHSQPNCGASDLADNWNLVEKILALMCTVYFVKKNLWKS